MPNAYYLVLKAFRQTARPGSPVCLCSFFLQKEKALLQCSLNYNTTTLRKPHRDLPIESNQKSTSDGYFLGLWIQSAKLHQTPQ